MAEVGSPGSQDSPHSDDYGNNQGGGDRNNSSVREQDRFLPIANISRIMKKALPANAKIAKDAKETIQECVSEFISFITSEYPQTFVCMSVLCLWMEKWWSVSLIRFQGSALASYEIAHPSLLSAWNWGMLIAAAMQLIRIAGYFVYGCFAVVVILSVWIHVASMWGERERALVPIVLPKSSAEQATSVRERKGRQSTAMIFFGLWAH